MNKKTKTRLIVFCVSAFLIVSPIALLYSQGYRIDFDNKRIVKTGGLYFKTFPKSAQILINGQEEEKTDFFFGVSLVENLFPNNYQVEIRKENYKPWTKNMEVKKGLVTEAKNIFLVPDSPEFEVLDQNIKGFWFSPDEKKFVTEEIQENSWSLKLYNTDSNTKSHLIEKKDISINANLLDLTWSPNSKNILLKTEFRNKANYLVLNLENIPAKIQEINFLSSYDEIFLHPIDSNAILFTKTEKNGLSLYEINLNTRRPNKLLSEVVSFTTDKNNIYWLDKQGYLNETNFNKETRSLVLAPIESNPNYQIKSIGSRIFLSENKKLFVLDKGLRTINQVASNVSNISLSPDQTKLCYWNGFEAWVLFLEQDSDQPYREKNSKVFLTRFSEKVNSFYWWNNHYLIFKTGNNIKIVETDNRDKNQIWDIEEFKAPEIYLSQNNKGLYILDENLLFFSRFLDF